MTRYVQHVSGQGEKWEVLVPHEVGHDWTAREDREWCIRAKDSQNGRMFVPKSEYRLVEQPERWVDVTEACRVVGWEYPDHPRPVLVLYHGSMLASWENGYRLTKSNVWKADGSDSIGGHSGYAFIVEKREP